MRNYYEVFGVSIDADFSKIKKSYRQLVKLYHPDVNAQSGSRFNEISKAYSVLRDPEKRRAYDAQIQNTVKATGSNFRFREIRNWLLSLSLIRLLFAGRRVSRTVQTVHPDIVKLDTRELLQRIRFSTNPTVGQIAVRALLQKKRHYVVNDLLRLLYADLDESVKIEIIRGVGSKSYNQVSKVLREIYQREKSIRVRTEIRKYIKLEY